MPNRSSRSVCWLRVSEAARSDALHAQKLLRLLELRPFGIRFLCDLEQLLVVRGRLAAIAGGRGCACASVETTEPIRFLLHRRFERRKRFLGLAGLEQHEAEQLARGRQRTGRDGGLVGRILRVGGGAEQRDRLVLATLRKGLPCERDATLN